MKKKGYWEELWEDYDSAKSLMEKSIVLFLIIGSALFWVPGWILLTPFTACVPLVDKIRRRKKQ